MNRKSNAWTAATLAIAAGCFVSVTAQSGGGAKGGQSGNANVNTVTITGCLQDRSSAAAGASAGATGGYILANVTTDSSGKSTTSTTAPYGAPPDEYRLNRAEGLSQTGSASPSPSASATATRYVVEGSDSDLKKHIGHRVEVTGIVGSTAMSTGSSVANDGYGSTPTASAASGNRDAAAGTSGSMAAAPHIRVTSVRMISSDCAGSGR
jgi:hypothetical protein